MQNGPALLLTARTAVNPVRGSTMNSVGEQKHCRKCGEWQNLEAFGKDRTRPDGRQSWCKACHNSYRRQRYITSEYDRTYQVTHKTQIATYVRSWRAGRGLSDKDRALRNARLHRWYWGNLDRGRAARKVKEHRRRARKVGNGGTYTVIQWESLCEQYGNCCLACGATGLLTVDHIVPLALGGANDIGNLQPLCGPCNSYKYARIIDYRPNKQEI